MSNQENIVEEKMPDEVNTTEELDVGRDTEHVVLKQEKNNGFENEKWVFHPTNPIRLKWDAAISIIMVYIVVNIPIQICFEVDLPLSHPWSWSDFALNVFFMVDILINLNTGFYFEERLILSRRLIAKQYMKLWFWLDLITSIPFDRLLTGKGANKVSSLSKILKIFRIFRLLKLLRMLRLMNQMSKWEERDDSSAARARLLKFVVVILLSGHIAACGWVGVAKYYRTGDRHDYNDYYGYDEMSWVVRFQSTYEKNVLELYLRALYWAFTTLTTVGYGDITPVLPLEVAFAVCTQLGGSTMFGFIIGNVASLMTREDENIMMIKGKMSSVSSYMQFRELPPPLIKRIRRHYEYSWKRSQAIKEEEIMGELPYSLRTECSLFIHRDIIRKTPFLSMLGDDVVPNLVTRLKPVLAGPTDIVVKETFHGNEMFFVSNGNLQLSFKNSLHLFDKRKTPDITVDELTHGDYFADYAVALDQAKHPVTAVAVDYCDLFVLTRADIVFFGEDFPLAYLKIIETCKTRYLELGQKIIRKRYEMILIANIGHLCRNAQEKEKQNERERMMRSHILNQQKSSRKLGKRFLQNALQSSRHSTSINSDIGSRCSSRVLKSELPSLCSSKVCHVDKEVLELTRGPSGTGLLSENNNPESASADKPSALYKILLYFKMRFLVREQSDENNEDETVAVACEEEEVKIASPILLKIFMWKNRVQFRLALMHMYNVEKRHREKYKLRHEGATRGSRALTGIDGEDLGPPRDRLQQDVDNMKVQLFQVHQALALIAQKLEVDGVSFPEKTEERGKTTSASVGNLLNLYNKDLTPKHSFRVHKEQPANEVKNNKSHKSTGESEFKNSTKPAATFSVDDEYEDAHIVNSRSSKDCLFFKIF